MAINVWKSHHSVVANKQLTLSLGKELLCQCMLHNQFVHMVVL